MRDLTGRLGKGGGVWCVGMNGRVFFFAGGGLMIHSVFLYAIVSILEDISRTWPIFAIHHHFCCWSC